MGYDDIEAMNWSSLKEMATSPRHYLWRTEHPRKDTPAFAAGRAIHCGLLEPDQYAARYIAEPEWGHSGRTNKGKEERALWAAEHAEQEISTPVIDETIEILRGRLVDHAEAHALLTGGQAEVTIEWTDKPTGTACKGRVDYLVADPPRVVDLKTTSRGLTRFDRAASDYLYHGQLAWYLDGAIAAGALPPNARAYIVAVETVGPFDVGAYEVADSDLAAGRKLYRRLLDLWRECSEANLWPGQVPTIQPLGLPQWAPGMSDVREEVWL